MTLLRKERLQRPAFTQAWPGARHSGLWRAPRALRALLALMSGLEASLPYDFLVRSIGKANLNASTLRLLPVPETNLAPEISLRGLLLNCLTKPYADLWQSCWDESYTSMSWAKDDPRLTADTFTSLTDEWDWHTPLRTDYERRQALVELDVLASMALGITFWTSSSTSTV